MSNPLRTDRTPLARQKPISRTPQPPPNNLLAEPPTPTPSLFSHPNRYFGPRLPKRKELESEESETAAQRSRTRADEEDPRIYLHNLKDPSALDFGPV
jgi:hypothetical protein